MIQARAQGVRVQCRDSLVAGMGPGGMPGSADHAAQWQYVFADIAVTAPVDALWKCV